MHQKRLGTTALGQMPKIGIHFIIYPGTLPSHEKGVPSSRWTHPAQVAAVALAATGLVSIEKRRVTTPVILPVWHQGLLENTI